MTVVQKSDPGVAQVVDLASRPVSAPPVLAATALIGVAAPKTALLVNGASALAAQSAAPSAIVVAPEIGPSAPAPVVSVPPETGHSRPGALVGIVPPLAIGLRSATDRPSGPVLPLAPAAPLTAPPLPIDPAAEIALPSLTAAALIAAPRPVR